MGNPETPYGHQDLLTRQRELMAEITALEGRGEHGKKLDRLHADYEKITSDLENYSRAA